MKRPTSATRIGDSDTIVTKRAKSDIESNTSSFEALLPSSSSSSSSRSPRRDNHCLVVAPTTDLLTKQEDHIWKVPEPLVRGSQLCVVVPISRTCLKDLALGKGREERATVLALENRICKNWFSVESDITPVLVDEHAANTICAMLNIVPLPFQLLVCLPGLRWLHKIAPLESLNVESDHITITTLTRDDHEEEAKKPIARTVRIPRFADYRNQLTVDKTEIIPLSAHGELRQLRSNPDYHRVRYLYRTSILASQPGNRTLAIAKTFLKGYTAHNTDRDAQTPAGLFDRKLPTSLFPYVMQFLLPNDILNGVGLTCRRLAARCRHDGLWQNLLAQHWPTAHRLCSELELQRLGKHLEPSSVLVLPYLAMFKQRWQDIHTSARSDGILVLEIGRINISCLVENISVRFKSSIEIHTFPNVAMEIQDDLYGYGWGDRLMDSKYTFVGDDDEQDRTTTIASRRFIVSEKELQANTAFGRENRSPLYCLLLRILDRCRQQRSITKIIWSSYTGQCFEGLAHVLRTSSRHLFGIPCSVSYVHPAVLVLFRRHVTTGLVLHLGHVWTSAYLAAVYRGYVMAHHTFQSDFAFLGQAPITLETLVTQVTDDPIGSSLNVKLDSLDSVQIRQVAQIISQRVQCLAQAHPQAAESLCCYITGARAVSMCARILGQLPSSWQLIDAGPNAEVLGGYDYATSF